MEPFAELACATHPKPECIANTSREDAYMASRYEARHVFQTYRYVYSYEVKHHAAIWQSDLYRSVLCEDVSPKANLSTA